MQRRNVLKTATAATLTMLAALPLCAQRPPQPVTKVVQASDGMTATVGEEALRVTVCGESLIHVTGSVRPVKEHAKPWMLERAQSCPGAKFTFAQTDKAATLTTAAVTVTFLLQYGNLTFADAEGKEFLSEGGDAPRTYEAAEVNGEATFHLAERFDPDAMEAFYGLGQHQSGMFNYRGSTVELGQNNTDVAIPLLVSSRGYAVLWNTASLSYADNRLPTELKFTALAGEGLDYYVIYGPEMDAIIHQYRTMTGHVPMFPRWAYGFFQSKDKYNSQQELLDIASRYRAEHIPMDVIVQDWFWWKQKGDPEFRAPYPDVPGTLKALHDEHVHAMLSIWPGMDPGGHNFAAMTEQHLDIPETHVYDATSPEARDFYWKNLAGKLFAQGWDAFWMDSSEPEEYWPHLGDAALSNKKLAIGSGAEYTNVYPLMHTGNVQEHWKETTDKKRVFLLTRSAFLGQQRNGAVTWSGDIYSTYWALQRQVPAGLNFALSGNPYWTTDTAGYFQPFKRPPTDPAYQKLYARWFEFSTFCPIFRTHGHRAQNEIWTYDQVEPILLRYDRLRYRMMPYIYSLAWRVTSADDTIQRPLVMDWRNDAKTWDLGDEFMFGPSLLVSPVTKEDATHRSVYLPASPVWYEFWSGRRVPSGELDAEAPLERIPVYVRAGAILPLGPEVEYADQDPQGAIELRVYRGADGSFDLYDDAGDSYDYEKGAYAITPIRWDEAAKTLTIGEQKGSFPGMAKRREFRVVWVGEGHGVGETVETKIDKTVIYEGRRVAVQAP